MPYATSHGRRIFYDVEGTGQPLVLYHGLTGSGERWQEPVMSPGSATAFGSCSSMLPVTAAATNHMKQPRTAG